SRYIRLDAEHAAEIVEGFNSLFQRADDWFEQERIAVSDRSALQSVDLRYAGQNYEINVPFPAEGSANERVEELRRQFEAAHQLTYGYTMPEEPVRVTALRLEAFGDVQKVSLERFPPGE